MSGKKNWKLNKTTRRVGSALLAVLMLVSVVAINAPSIRERGYAMSSVNNAEAEELDVNDENVSGGEGAEDSAEGAEDTAGADAEQAEENAEGAEDADSEDADGDSAEDADDAEQPEEDDAEQAVADEERGEEAEDLLIQGDRILTAEGKNYTVTAAFGADAEIPEKAELKVELIDPNTKEYQERFEEAQAKLNEEAGLPAAEEAKKEAVKTEEETGTVATVVEPTYTFHLFDISFVVDGEEIEPNDKVQVKIDFKAEDMANTSDATIVHFDEEKGAEVLEKQKVEADDEGNVTAAFESDLFSEYAVVESGTSLENGEYIIFYQNGNNYYAIDNQGNRVPIYKQANGKFSITDSSIQWNIAPTNYNYTAGYNITSVGNTSTHLCPYFENNTGTLFRNHPVKIDGNGYIRRIDYDSVLIGINNQNKFAAMYSDWSPSDWNSYVSSRTFQFAKVETTQTTNLGSMTQIANTVDSRQDGIRINLFDYGTLALDESSNIYGNNGSGTINMAGINGYIGGGSNGYTVKDDAQKKSYNKYLLFLFSGEGSYHANSPYTPGNDSDKWAQDGTAHINNYSGAYKPVQKVVNPYLAKSSYDNKYYPVLTTGGGSLDYLFNDQNLGNNTTSDNAKKVYEDVNHLFVKNEQGAYYFDSSEYYAYYNKTDSTTTNDKAGDFTLYGPTYDNKDNVKDGIGFFPFDTPNVNDTEISGHNGNAGSNRYNHHIGLSMEAKFVMPENGKVQYQSGSETKEAPMKFEFSGDDDMWVFIDGILVLDIGGVHQPVDGTIDFSDGSVKITGYDNSDKTGPNTYTDTYIKTLYESAISKMSATEKANFTTAVNTEWNGNTFADYSTHTMQIFYMERGGQYSNLKITTNIQTFDTENVVIQKKLSGTDEQIEQYKDTGFPFKVRYQVEGDSEIKTYTGAATKVDLNGNKTTVWPGNGANATTEADKSGEFFYLNTGEKLIIENKSMSSLNEIKRIHYWVQEQTIQDNVFIVKVNGEYVSNQTSEGITGDDYAQGTTGEGNVPNIFDNTPPDQTVSVKKQWLNENNQVIAAPTGSNSTVITGTMVQKRGEGDNAPIRKRAIVLNQSNNWTMTNVFGEETGTTYTYYWESDPTETGAPAGYVFNSTIQDSTFSNVKTLSVSNKLNFVPKTYKVEKKWLDTNGTEYASDKTPNIVVNGNLKQTISKKEGVTYRTVEFANHVSDDHDYFFSIEVPSGSTLTFHTVDQTFKPQIDSTEVTSDSKYGNNYYTYTIPDSGSGTITIDTYTRNNTYGVDYPAPKGEYPFTLNSSGWSKEWTTTADIQDAVNNHKIYEIPGVEYTYSVTENPVENYTLQPIAPPVIDGNTISYTLKNQKDRPDLKLHKVGVTYAMNSSESTVVEEHMTGVEFTVVRTTNDADKGKYLLANGSYATTETKLPVDNDGKLTITKVPDGTYTIHEATGHPGFMIGADWTVTVEDGVVMSVKQGNDDVATDDFGYRLDNTKLYDLPSAGGPGTYLFTIGGVAMIFTALLLWIKPYRKEARTEE